MTTRAAILEAFREYGPRLTSWEVAAAVDLPLRRTTAHIGKLCQVGRLRRVRVTRRGGSRGRKLVEYEVIT